MAAVLGGILRDEARATFQRVFTHTVPEGISGLGGGWGGLQVFSRGSTEPTLCSKKITLTGLWKRDYWEGQVGSYSSDQKL